jgi:arylformamidase
MDVGWRQLPKDRFAQIYNPRLASHDVDGTLKRYAKRSAEARNMLPSTAVVSNDLRYGSGPLQTLDLYRPTEVRLKHRPLILFIHGGYWRGLDKHDYSFVVPPLNDAGAIVANVNYDLCPQMSLSEMVLQIIEAVRFCHKQAVEWGASREKVVIVGHSAGAHLSARVLNQPADSEGLPANLVCGVAAISGIYEPEIILNLDVNDEAQITPEDAAQNDCLSAQPMGAARMAIWAGSQEPQGWIDQSRTYASLAVATGIETHFFEEEQTDHFTVVETAFQTTSKGWSAIQNLCSF